MNITFISSYIPRKCGIATYTRDLSSQLEKQGNSITIIAMENLIVPNQYDLPVTDIIRQENKQDYLDVAKKINENTTDIVHLQHEFGLFGGKDGRYILTLAKLLTKPLIVTFHTVLLTPTKSQKYIIQELARLSSKVIVMDQVAKTRLENIYGLNSSDVEIILHGAPEVISVSKEIAKKKINLSGNFIMLANNLLSRNKGIEYGIEAVAKALKYIPNLLFLIVGETHPVVKAEEGESYRKELMNLVKKLGVEKNVRFVNKYVSLEELTGYLTAADIYITPYLDPEQTSSGTLSYAIGFGKACIATEYVYAKEMLSKNKGIVVPFKNSNAICQALIKLYNNPNELQRLENSVEVFGKKMGWSSVSKRHTLVYKKIILSNTNLHLTIQNFIKSSTDISYLRFLTNSTGIFQHANKTLPNLKFGFSTDDNARALIVVAQIFNKNQNQEISNLIQIYCRFLSLAQTSNGKFHTFLDVDEKWTDKPAITDAFGRAIWGLGFYLNSCKLHSDHSKMFKIFQKSTKQFKNILDLRTAAYAILGLYYFIEGYKFEKKITKNATDHLEKLANLIIASYERNSSAKWNWFENTVTYDNFRLPQALFAAYIITKKTTYKKIAKSSLKFLDKYNFNKKRNYFDFIGQDGWLNKDTKKANYDQQPLEAAGAVDANIFAALALDDSSYITKANLAFDWFFGKNRNHRSMYNKKSNGVADGLTPRGINVNQGSESIICFLMAQQSLQQLNESENEVIIPSAKSNFIYQPIQQHL